MPRAHRAAGMRIYALRERRLVPWPASNKMRNHLGVRLFSTVQNIEYQCAYQTPGGAIRVRIRFGAAIGVVSNFCADETANTWERHLAASGSGLPITHGKTIPLSQQSA
jgi:hypothetical protein